MHALRDTEALEQESTITALKDWELPCETYFFHSDFEFCMLTEASSLCRLIVAHVLAETCLFYKGVSPIQQDLLHFANVMLQILCSWTLYIVPFLFNTSSCLLLFIFSVCMVYILIDICKPN
jgi:hypothetical protein